MRYGFDQSAEGKSITFPAPPSPPRYSYAGELIGERNFVFDLPEKTFGQKVLEWLTGVADNRTILELARPQAVVADLLGRVFVSDAGLSGVFVFDAVDGSARLLRGFSGRQVFKSPSGICVTPEGMIYVADAELGAVAVLNPEGMPVRVVGAGALVRPAGLVCDEATGRLFVADSADHSIKVFDHQDALILTLGGLGDQPGRFNRPTHIALGHGNLYVSDTLNARVQVLDATTGKPKRVIGARGRMVGQLSLPKGVATDSDGNVYVVESLHDHLLIFDKEGRFLLPIGGTGYGTGQFYLPAGLWIDRDNRIYVADMFNGRIATYLSLGNESEAAD